MKITETNQSIDDLAALNTFLQGMEADEKVTAGATAALPLVAASFTNGGSATAAEIDQAVSDSDTWWSNQWADIDDIVAAVDTALHAIVADPEGYESCENANVWAYINTGDFNPDRQCLNLLVSAAHGMGESLHRSSQMRGLAEGTPYVHALGPNKLYAFSEDGNHRGYPKITVIAEGDVNAGVHRF